MSDEADYEAEKQMLAHYDGVWAAEAKEEHERRIEQTCLRLMAMGSPVILERAYDGRTRIRCTRHDKVAYDSEDRAKEAAATVTASAGYKFYHYPGQRCGTWHLASERPVSRPRGRTSIRLTRSDDPRRPNQQPVKVEEVNELLRRASVFDRSNPL